MNLEDIIKQCPKNQTIIDNIIKAYHKINNAIYNKITCSVSGGADSDVMIDICSKCDNDKKIVYIWSDTGLEYEATKKHLKHLEDKYNIEIMRVKALKPIPICCKEYGQPFLSKRVSDYIQRLQRHNFDFKNDGNKNFNELCEKYKKCQTALKWWCNEWGDGSIFNILKNKWLKEFMILNPPPFKISDKCCIYSKKGSLEGFLKEYETDLHMIGVRKAERGLRTTAYKSCFDENVDGHDNYRPLFYYKDEDKEQYENHFDVEHSKCYTEYGLKRTGCTGCPFGRDFEEELLVIQKYEPKLYKAVNKIFGDSYEYTRKYKNFCNSMDEKYGSYAAYLRLK